MAVDVGQAQLKDEMHEMLGFSPGQLGGEFAKGGVSEVEPSLNSGKILSMEDFRRAESSLEHAPETLRDIENADLSAAARLEGKLEHDTFQYSQKETGREQNGGASDDNTVTALGRLKVGIQDAGADKRKRDEKRSQHAYLTITRNQMAHMDQLQAEMNRLLEEIDQLKDEITELEKDSAIAEELMANIDDLNSDDPDTRKSVMNKTKSYLARHNIDIEDFKDKDDSYDTKAVHDALNHQHSDNEKQIIEKSEKIEENIQELKSIDIERANISQQQTTPTTEERNNAQTAQVSIYDSLLGDRSEGSAFYDFTEGAFDTAFDGAAQLETFDANNAVGSFAGSGENTSSVIASHFTAKADVNQPTAEVTNDLQNNRTLPSTAINGPV